MAYDINAVMHNSQNMKTLQETLNNMMKHSKQHKYGIKTKMKKQKKEHLYMTVYERFEQYITLF